MPYRVKTAGSISASAATDADIQRAFANDSARGEFVILEAADGSFMQTAGEGDGPYVLEYRDGPTEHHIKAKSELTKAQVEEAFLSFLHGNDVWQHKWEWETLERKAGCLHSAALIVIAIIALASW